MVLKADQERVKTLLKDTITLLCRNGLTFKSKFSIEALIGVTLDDNDVFLVSINELIRSEKAHTKESSISNSHRETDNSQKKPSRSSSDKDKQRETRERDHRQHKRKRPEVKEEDESTEEDEDLDEPEEGEICMPYIQKQHMHMWDEEEDHGSTGYDDSSSQSFPPVGECMLPCHDNAQHMSPVKQARIQAQPRMPQRVIENTDIVYIKEEPDDEESWPPPEEEDIDESELTHDGMFTNMAGMANSAFDEEQNFHHVSELNYAHGGAVMISPSAQSIKQQQWSQPQHHQQQQNQHHQPQQQHQQHPQQQHQQHPQQQHQQQHQQHPQQYQQLRSATVTSDGQHQQQQHHQPQQQQQQQQQHQKQQQQQHAKQQQKHQQQLQQHQQQPPPHQSQQQQSHQQQQQTQQQQQQEQDMPITSTIDIQPQDEMDGENCFYAVCDYDEEYEMSQEMSQDMSHDLGQMPSPQPSSAKKSRPSSSLQTMYFCQICGQSFNSLAAYNTHKDEHKGIFKFPCSECDKGYSTKAKLNTHMRHHTGERFLCTWCGKGFMSKTSLKRHAKAQHDYQI